MPSGSVNGGSGKKSGAKSAKAISAAAKKSGGGRGLPKQRQIPWMVIGGVVAVVALIAVIAVSIIPKYQDQQKLAAWTPSESNQDPSTALEGIVTVDYPAGQHIEAPQRVAYDRTPPFGGPHDSIWATCTGVVYPEAIRTENAVHSLEHGAVWITYNPDLVDAAGVETLSAKVDGKSYTMMSPYPGQASPISLQSWGHQLAVDSADDERIDQFISALRQNRYTYPEVGASCATIPGSYDPANPPPFDPSAPGPDAVPMTGGTVDPAEVQTDMQAPAGS
ncbi:DUF3105 domain-containing protein [Rhodococcus sp. O3]|uniref:DUF3105 domain-containing protein n=1 Tax=Rhodococcus sp. O3 TaxID=3404919 RepID=UPI003B67B74A